MRIEFLTNNSQTIFLADWLRKDAGEDVIIFDQKLTPEIIRQHKPDFFVSFGYRFIIPAEILELVPGKFINLHVSLLPWNRGAQPNLWSFLDNTPKGVTIHLINPGLDKGSILVQQEVNIDEGSSTLSSSYDLLQKTIQELFKSNWDKIKTDKIVAQSQILGGSYHGLKDFDKISSILGEEGWNISISLLKQRYEEFKLSHNKNSK